MTVQIAQIKVLASFILSAVYILPIFNKDKGLTQNKGCASTLDRSSACVFFCGSLSLSSSCVQWKQ